MIGLNPRTITEFKDPFTKDCVDQVWFWCRKDYHGKIEYSATVEFRNGKTKGEQDFEAESFEATVKKVENFISQL